MWYSTLKSDLSFIFLVVTWISLGNLCRCLVGGVRWGIVHGSAWNYFHAGQQALTISCSPLPCNLAVCQLEHSHPLLSSTLWSIDWDVHMQQMGDLEHTITAHIQYLLIQVMGIGHVLNKNRYTYYTECTWFPFIQFNEIGIFFLLWWKCLSLFLLVTLSWKISARSEIKLR